MGTRRGRRVTGGIGLTGVAALAFVASGCASAARVHRAPSNSSNFDALPGIPFYVKQAACIHKTEYLEELFTLTLTQELVEVKDKTLGNVTPLQSIAKVVDRSTYDSDLVRGLREVVATAGLIGVAGLTDKDRDALRQALRDFMKIPESKPANPDSNTALTILANTAEPYVYVDYWTEYTINAAQPWFGSASLTGEFAADGTLTKATVSAESKPQEIAGMLPTKEVLSSLLIPAEAAGALGLPEQAPTFAYRFKLTESQRNIVHTLSRVVEVKQPCGVGSALAFGDSDRATYEYTRSERTTAKPEPKKSRAVKVSGEIELPAKEK